MALPVGLPLRGEQLRREPRGRSTDIFRGRVGAIEQCCEKPSRPTPHRRPPHALSESAARDMPTLMDDYRRFTSRKVDRYLDTPGGVLRYCDMGAGEPLIVIHGITGSYDYYFYTMEHFARDHRVIGYNYRGDPGQEDPPDPYYTHDDLVDDLARLVDHLGYDRVHVFGSSFGGTIAMRFALRYPAMTGKLLLHSTFAHYDLRGLLRRMLWAFDKMPLARIPFRRFVRIIRRMNLMDERTPDQFRFTEKQFYSTPYKTLVRRLHFLRDLDFVDQLADLRAPTFLVWGANDVVVTPAHNRVLVEHIPRISETVLENCGHGCYIACRDEFNACLRAFLEGAPANANA